MHAFYMSTYSFLFALIAIITTLFGIPSGPGAFRPELYSVPGGLLFHP